MNIQLLMQFRAKPGRSGELLSVVLRLLPRERRPEGCLEARVRQNQDDASDIVAEQTWQSRLQAERWRADPHLLTAIRGLSAEPLQVRCYETVEPVSGPQREPVARDESLTSASMPAEVPKVSTPDALGG